MRFLCYYSQVEKKLYSVLHPILKADGGSTSFVQFLACHSLTPTITTFMNGEDKATFVGQVNFTPYRIRYQQFCMDRKLRSKDTGILNICPVCLREDQTKYGIFYYHRSHQFPYVTICYKHGCSLMTYSGPVGKEFTFDMFDEIVSDIIPEPRDYAIFCHKLLQKPLPLYRMNYIEIFSSMNLQKPLREWKMIFNIFKFHSPSLSHLSCTGASSFLVFLFLLFGTAEEYWKLFQGMGDEMGNIMDEKAKQCGYIQVSPRVGAIMELQKMEGAQVIASVGNTSFICDGIIFIPHSR